MKTLVAAFCLLSITSQCLAGEWVRTADDTVSFSGFIKADEFKSFQAVYDSKVKTLVVDSLGGDVGAGVEIANVIFKNKLNILVRGVCISSCANYLFTAAHEKTIEKGIVGFHGNWKAWTKTEDFKNRINALPEAQRAEKKNSILKVVAEEIKFLSKVGVSQELFEHTQTVDDGTVYLLKPQTFKKYGIKNVKGIQDMETFKRAYPTATVFVE